MKPKRFKAVVFDLDDTLYPESQYVMSGLRAVSRYVYKLFGKNLYEELEARYLAGERGDLFTPTLQRYFKQVEPLLVQRLHEIYYCHKPSLDLFTDARVALAVLASRAIPAGLLTDGYGHVQRNKVESLDLRPLIQSFVYADDLGGPDYWKPCPDAFQIIALQLELEPYEMVYVGDNPAMDFLAPRQLGMGTIRIIRKRGEHKGDQAPTPAHEAHISITSLDMLWEALQVLDRSQSDIRPESATSTLEMSVG